jgi:flagellin
MALRIQNNIEALGAHRSLQATNQSLTKSMARLSSGYRVNSGADDAAGLAISERMRGQIRGVSQAMRNAQDGISMVQTTEGAMSEVHSMLQRVRELAVQFKTGSLSPEDRTAIQSEVFQLASEIERIGTQTNFNGVCLLNQATSVTFQVGANDGEVISIPTISLSSALGTAWFSLTVAGATDISEIDEAINVVSAQRAIYGSVQNRFEYLLNSLGSYHQNLVSAESRVRDLDMAQGMVDMTRWQVLQQAGTAMLAQANQMPNTVLQLLQR